MEDTGKLPEILPPQVIEKPASVTVFGVLNCVFGGFGIICSPFSLLGLFAGDLFPGSKNQLQIVAGYKAFLVISAFLGIGIASLLILLGVGLLTFKPWARRGSVIYAWFAIIWGVIAGGLNVAAYALGWIGSAPKGTPEYVGGIVGGICGGVIGLIYPVLLLIFMLLPRVKRVFSEIGG